MAANPYHNFIRMRPALSLETWQRRQQKAPMALAPLIIRWGDTSSDMLRRSARCTKCGHEGATLQPVSWGGMAGGFKEWPA